MWWQSLQDHISLSTLIVSVQIGQSYLALLSTDGKKGVADDSLTPLCKDHRKDVHQEPLEFD
jgi:hypothetical protein